MVDLLSDTLAPGQTPTLTELEAARIEASDDHWRAMEWLMVADETPDLGTVLAQLLMRPAWHQLAACRGIGHELFFPERGQSVEPAHANCEWCPVRDECLAWALESAEDGTPAERVGVWGGTSERQRRVLRRGRAVA